MAETLRDVSSEDQGSIAVIGMSCRFPGAKTPAAYWRNLCDGIEAVRSFSDAELDSAGIDSATRQHASFVNAGVVLEDHDLFDAEFFGFNPRDAEILDPQQRLFLECAWEALEDAAYVPADYDGLIGVYAGADMSTYMFNLYGNPEIMQTTGPFQVLLSTDKDHLTTRTAYKLNLRGPAVTVQTTCSTSLVAICQACQSLLNYQSDIVLAGGTSLALPQKAGYVYQPGGISSPDGHCRAFDASAKGTIGGSGAGVVALKRYADALADHDNIHAVIRGFALNNDGAVKVGYTAPSIEGQAEAIAMAQAMADVAPETVTYIEAHGTGTPMGDPIEVSALTKVFRADTDATNFCGIGSVKTNFGHLNSAAGVAGFIKTVLALKHGKLPPSLHFQRPNPALKLDTSPFYVVDRLTRWQPDCGIRRAGVSSFGIGGTNAHVVLEQTRSLAATGTAPRRWQVLPVSARDRVALDSGVASLAAHLREVEDLSIADVAYTLQAGRTAFPERQVAICPEDSVAIAADTLESRDPRRVFSGRARNTPAVLFAFPGQGAQHVNMARANYAEEPVFRQHFDQCDALLVREVGQSLRQIVFPEAGSEQDAEAILGRTEFTQPALFAVEYALAQLWMHWGIRPVAMLGHSLGEYVAACLSGVMSLEDAFLATARRAGFCENAPHGAMLAVAAAEATVAKCLVDDAWISVVNARTACVVGGTDAALSRQEQRLTEDGIACKRLRMTRAFHTRLMAPAARQLEDCLRGIALTPGQLPYLSNVTGTWVRAEDATDPGYWARHLLEPVRFADNLTAARQRFPDAIMLEVGPGASICALAQQQEYSPAQLVPSLGRTGDKDPETAQLAKAVGKLWLSGVDIDWQALRDDRRGSRVSLPTYAFQRKRYWVDPPWRKAGGQVPKRDGDERNSLDSWFYRPVWRRTGPESDLVPVAEKPERWWVFDDDGDLADYLIDRGQQVTRISRAQRFERKGDGHYLLDPSRAEHYRRLFAEHGEANGTPDRIVHMWSLAEPGRSGNGFDDAHTAALQCGSFFSPLYLVQALAAAPGNRTRRVLLVSSEMYNVSGDETPVALRAMLAGVATVTAQELPQCGCSCLDVGRSANRATTAAQIPRRIAAEALANAADSVVACRDGSRWQAAYEQVTPQARPKPALRERGVYLITGGFGGIGMALAKYLATTVQARLVLLGRRPVPERSAWPQWLEAHDADDDVVTMIHAIRSLEQLGGEVLPISADVANAGQMSNAMTQLVDAYGALDGVVHAAGVAGGGLIQLKTTEAAGKVVDPKVTGTLVLKAATDALEPDFFVVCSSLAAILGGVGQVDYCAANCFLDAFAESFASDSPTAVMSINWDTWSEAGMAIDTELPDELEAARLASLRAGIRSTEGAEAFHRVLSSGLTRVAVSTLDLNTRISQWNLSPAAQQPASPAVDLNQHARPELASAFVAPAGATEIAVAAIWQELLGIDRVGVHDDFLLLGGHSLLALQVLSRIRNTFGIELEVRTMFEAGTVAQLACTIDARGESSDRLAEMDRVLRKVEELSDSAEPAHRQ